MRNAAFALKKAGLERAPFKIEMYILSPRREVISKPLQFYISYTIMFKFCKKNFMAYGVKRLFKVNKDGNVYFAIVNCLKDVLGEVKK